MHVTHHFNDFWKEQAMKPSIDPRCAMTGGRP